MSTLSEILKSDLSTIYNEIERETDVRSFYRKVALYGKIVEESRVCSEIIAQLLESSIEMRKSLGEASSNFLIAWKPLAEDIQNLAVKEGFNDANSILLSQQLTTLSKSLLEGELNYWEFNIDAYFSSYKYILEKLVKTKSLNKLLGKHIIKIESASNSTDEDQFAYPLFGLYYNLNSEWKRYKTLREDTVWWAHYQIQRLAGGIFRTPHLQVYFNNDDDVSQLYKSVFDQLARDGYDQSGILRKSKYDTYIQRLHSYIVPRIDHLGDTDRSFCKFESNTMTVQLNNGASRTVDFEDQRGTKNMIHFINVMFSHWQKLGEEPLEISEIERRLIKLGIDEDKFQNRNFLQSTISNIRGKIDGKDLAEIIMIKYDKAPDGYKLTIKKPQIQ